MTARILVVDDEPSVLAVVSRALRDEGHEVIAVSNGQTAYDVALDQTVDVVVTNSRTGLNGTELVSAVRKRFPGIPILHLDDHSLAAHSQIQVPADVPTLFKPFDLVALQAAVRRLLKPRRPSRPEFATAS
jgi:two-component system, cell cycle response regulator CpdR